MRASAGRGTALRFALLCALCALCALLLVGIAGQRAFANDEEKSTVPTVEKQVAEVAEDGTVSWQEYADAAMGVWTSYRLTGTLPSDLADFTSYYYEFSDCVSTALEIDMDSVAVVLVDAETGAQIDLTAYATVTYTDAGDGTATLSVAISDLLSLGLDLDAADTLVLSYSARLVAGTAQAGAENGASGYACIVYTASTEGDGTERSAESAATLLTWAIELSKVDADTGEALAGATFTIQNAAGQYVAADGTLADEAVELACGEDGVLSVVGLDAGTYTVAETAAPDGYEAADAFALVIESALGTEPIELSASVSGADAALLAADADSGVVSLQVADAAEGAQAGGTATTDEDSDSDDDPSSSSIVSTILSKTGDNLFAILVLVGAALAAGMLLPPAFAHRRRSRQDREA